MAFGVFGDGPYLRLEHGRYRAMLEDVAAADVDFLIHVGDILADDCLDEVYMRRRSDFDALPLAVIYTPGDNEWTDCHDEGVDPLERLGAIRRVFFAEPERSLGGEPIPLESQASNPSYGEFPENALWSAGGFVFATMHMVGSMNGLRTFRGRTERHDDAVERRTRAALEWMDRAFARARRDSASGVVLVIHGNPWENETGYEDFLARLMARLRSYDRPVLLIHGDTHTYRVDQPLMDSLGRSFPTFQRLETYGSPTIGWVRVVVDTAAGRIARFEPRSMGIF